MSDHLFEALLNGTLDPAGMRRLNDALKSDTDARARFAAFVEEWTLIGATAHELAVAAPSEREPSAGDESDVFPASDDASGAAAIVSRSPVGRRRRRAGRPAWLRDWTRTVLPLAAAVMLAAIVYAVGPWGTDGAGRDDASARATVIEVAGGVTVGEGGETTSLTRGRVIVPGEVLVSATDARCQLQYPDGTLLDVAGEAQLTLRGGRSGKRVDIARGTLTASVARQDPAAPMKLVTPHAFVTVLGTAFTLSAERDQSYLEVAEGRVRLERKADGARVVVESEQYVFVPERGELDVKPMRPPVHAARLRDELVWSRPATIVVSTEGDDDNPGTSEAPLRTISRAARAAVSGDVIEVAAGTYRDEAIEFTGSGEAEAPIVLRAARGAEVVVKGSAVVSDWRRLPGPMPVYVHEKWPHHFGRRRGATGDAEPTRPRFTDARALPWNQVFVDGRYVREVTGRDELARGTFFVDRRGKRIYLVLEDGGDPNAGVVEVSRTSGPLLTTAGQSHVVVHGIAFAHGANRPQSNGLVRVTEGDSCVVDACRVEWAAGAGLSVVGGVRHVVSRCVLNHNGEMGFNVNRSSGCRVERCVTAYNNRHPGKRYDPTWEGGACKVNRARDLTIDRLHSQHNDGNGVWIDIASRNCAVTNSVLHDNRNGIVYEISYGGLIANNICYRSRRSPGDNAHAPSGAGIAVVSAAGCRVYHNTVWDNEGGGITISALIRGDGDGHQVTSHSNSYVNNIVAETTPGLEPTAFAASMARAAPVAVLANPVLAYGPSESDYNVYWPAATPSGPAVPGEEHSLYANPKFVDASRGEFRLRTGSPARDRAKRMADVVTDLAGAARAGDAGSDVGALEAGRDQAKEDEPWPPLHVEDVEE